MYTVLGPVRSAVWETFDKLAIEKDTKSIQSLHLIEKLTVEEVFKVYAIDNYAGCGNLKVLKWLVDTFSVTREQIEDDFTSICTFTAGEGHCNVLRWMFRVWGLPSVDPDTRPWYIDAIEDASCSGHIGMVTYLTRKFQLGRFDVLPFNNRSIKLAITGGHVRLVVRLLELYKLHPSERDHALRYALMYLSDHAEMYQKFADPRKYHQPVIKRKRIPTRSKKICSDVDLSVDVNAGVKFLWVKFLVKTLGISRSIVRDWLYSDADRIHPRTDKYLDWIMTKGTSRTAPLNISEFH